MTSSVQHWSWISRIGLRGASGAIALAGVLALGLVATQPMQAQDITYLYNFAGDPDGAYPVAGLVQDAAGNLYSTTEEGGFGFGTVFKVNRAGK